jgi:hypothetical protein
VAELIVCGHCDGSVEPSMHRCPGCRYVLVGWRCTHCNVLGSWEDAPGSACPCCGTPVRVAWAEERPSVWHCPACARLVLGYFPGSPCPRCGFMDWSGPAASGLLAAGGAVLSWFASASISEPVVSGIVRWGGLLVSAGVAAVAAKCLFSWVATARARARADAGRGENAAEPGGAPNTGRGSCSAEG